MIVFANRIVVHRVASGGLVPAVVSSWGQLHGEEGKENGFEIYFSLE
jgi:hypothetical protein